MTGKDLKLSGTQADIDPTTGQPIVTMQFNGQGQQALPPDHPGRGAARPAARHPRRASRSSSTTRSTRSRRSTTSSTATGSTRPAAAPQITGIASQKEAQNLALVLQTGALPVKFVTVERSDVSATLGKDSLRQARNAAIVGLIARRDLPAPPLPLPRRRRGASGSRSTRRCMYGAILLLGVTLTLPGFAGLILTIGVAADANVVIFERIKEEARAGQIACAPRSPPGYAKGFRTIVDANVVTAITALILFARRDRRGQGLRADAADRHRRLAVHRRRRDARDARPARRLPLVRQSRASWARPRSEIPRWQRIDVVTRRRLYFIISLVAVGLSVLAIIVQGLNLGIDFKGGVQVHVHDAEAGRRSRSVRNQTAAIGRGDASSRAAATPTGSDSYTSFQIRLKKLQPAEQDEADERPHEDASHAEAARREERLGELQPADPARARSWRSSSRSR